MTKNKIFSLLLLAALLVFAICGCSAIKEDPGLAIDAEGTLRIHYIDVGQGDCALVQTPDNKNMLIDAGNPENYEAIHTYLNAQKVDTLDILLITHPHSDHMGSAEKILEHYTVNAVYMPKVSHNTNLFKNVMAAIQEKGLKINAAYAGAAIQAGDAVDITFFSPVQDKSYDGLNDYSPITKITYGDTSFLFTGDAELENEEDAFAQGGINLKSDVLKVGHHGSNTSTGDLFLSVVNPQYAVISVGEGNSYGHPSADILNKLKDKTIFRTDKDGNVVAISDGRGISFITQNQGAVSAPETTAAMPSATETAEGYIGNVNTKKFHLPSCSGLPKENNRIDFQDRDEALNQGYSPCGICKP